MEDKAKSVLAKAQSKRVKILSKIFYHLFIVMIYYTVSQKKRHPYNNVNNLRMEVPNLLPCGAVFFWTRFMLQCFNYIVYLYELIPYFSKLRPLVRVECYLCKFN